MVKGSGVGSGHFSRWESGGDKEMLLGGAEGGGGVAWGGLMWW